MIFGAAIKQHISLGTGQNMLTGDHVKTEAFGRRDTAIRGAFYTLHIVVVINISG